MPIATATSAPWSAGASFTPSPVTATIRWPGARGAHEAQLLVGRRAGDDVDVGPAPPRAARRPSVASSSPVTMWSASRPASRGDRRRGPRVVAGDDHDLDARSPGRRHRVGDAGPDRVGEADEGADLPRPVVDPPGQRDEALAGGRRGLDQRRPSAPARSSAGRAAVHVVEDDLRGTEGELLDVTVPPRPRPGDRQCARRRARPRAASSHRARSRRPPRATAARSARVNEAGAISSPGQASSSARSASSSSVRRSGPSSTRPVRASGPTTPRAGSG